MVLHRCLHIIKSGVHNNSMQISPNIKVKRFSIFNKIVHIQGVSQYSPINQEF